MKDNSAQAQPSSPPGSTEPQSSTSMAELQRTKRFFYPEVGAGGYAHCDGTVEFFGRVNALLSPDMVVLDFGAGRGRGVREDPVPWRRYLQTLKGKCQKLVGADIDPAVLENPGLDEAYLIGQEGSLPFDTGSFDLIVSDATFEHIADPESTLSELKRVLKPGGWLCARTPNRWGYIGFGTNLIPNRWHVALLKYLQPHRKAEDVFPTVYKLNTRKALRKHFPLADWEHCEYGHFAEPAYFGTYRPLWAVVLLAYRLIPSSLAPTWMIFMRKRNG